MWMKEKSDVRTSAARGDAADMDPGQDPGFGSGDGSSDVIAFVGKGVEFKGVISYNGTVRIDGHLDGEIHTEGVLLIGEDASITAKISAGTVISKGKITGDIAAKEKVRLLSPAEFNGSVKTPVLSMEEGVLFNGNCEMSRAEVRELSRENVVRAVSQAGPGMKRISG